MNKDDIQEALDFLYREATRQPSHGTSRSQDCYKTIRKALSRLEASFGSSEDALMAELKEVYLSCDYTPNHTRGLTAKTFMGVPIEEAMQRILQEPVKQSCFSESAENCTQDGLSSANERQSPVDVETLKIAAHLEVAASTNDEDKFSQRITGASIAIEFLASQGYLGQAWQDISTAPRDDDELIIAYCVSDKGYWQEPCIVRTNGVRSILLPDLGFHYTHWMPLPKPPTGE